MQIIILKRVRIHLTDQQSLEQNLIQMPQKPQSIREKEKQKTQFLIPQNAGSQSKKKNSKINENTHRHGLLPFQQINEKNVVR